MADHKVQRPTPGNPLTRRQKDINVAINREGVPAGIARDAAAAAPAPSTRDILSTRGAAIDAAVEGAVSGRLKANQSTDAAN